jgi:hypothetical protein
MKMKEINAALAEGEILCSAHGPKGTEYWLEPSYMTVRSDLAERLIQTLQPGGDSLFSDHLSQTWRAK